MDISINSGAGYNEGIFTIKFEYSNNKVLQKFAFYYIIFWFKIKTLFRKKSFFNAI